MIYDYVIVYFFGNFFWLIQKIIAFNKFSELLPAFICARAIGNLWGVCLEVCILSPFVDFHGNNPLLKALITNSLPS